MGNLLKTILNSFSDMKAKVLMIGLDNAGKTTILYQMRLGQVPHTSPTIGFNVEEVKYNGLNFTIWDIGGQTRLRNLWHHYYVGTDSLIYVVDSSDSERMTEAKNILNEVISNEDIKNIPVLVLANKMDATSLTAVQIAEKLGLPQLRTNWHLQPCCGLNGSGIVQGFEWVRKQLKKSKK